jgi:hypothetical protein
MRPGLRTVRASLSCLALPMRDISHRPRALTNAGGYPPGERVLAQSSGRGGRQFGEPRLQVTLPLIPTDLKREPDRSMGTT